MPNPFDELLAGLAGGFTGYGQQQDINLQRQRQATNDAALNDDRLSQIALRKAQQAQTDAKAQQDQYLRTPEFQNAFKAARAGDEGAIAHVASAVAGHPDAASYMNALVRPPKTQYDATRGGMVDTEHNTFTPTPGISPTPKAPVQGTQEYLDALAKEEDVKRTHGYHAPVGEWSETSSVGPNGRMMLMNKVTGERREADAGTPKQPGGGGQGALASVADMDERLKQLTEGFGYFSNGAGAGKVQPSWQTRDALEQRVGQAQAHNTTDIKGQAMTGIANVVGYGPNQNDPDFQKYRQIMQAARFIGEESANAQKGRGNEAKVRRDIELAMPIPSDFQNPAKLQDKLVRLQNLANLARATQPNTAGVSAPSTPGGGRAGGGRPSATSGNINLGSVTAAERAGLKAQGFTDEQITAKYGPPTE